MDMVERVARAIEAAMNDGSPTGWAGEFEFRDLARAAIAAMREPTEGMMEAGWKYSSARTAYQGMIDAALTSSEKGGVIERTEIP